MSRKACDTKTIPLCYNCHDRLHKVSEKVFFAENNIDGHEVAHSLWMMTRDYDSAYQYIQEYLKNRKNIS